MKHLPLTSVRSALSVFLLSAATVISLPVAAQGLPAEVVHVKKQPLERQIRSVGNLRANEAILLRPEQSGRIEKVLFSEGEPVQQLSLIHI